MLKTMVVVGGVVAGVFGWGYWRYPPTSPESMAGWVQAFGSIVAIGLAVWLQHQASGDRVRQATQVAKAFAIQLVKTVDMIQLAARTEQWTEFRTGQQMLIDTLGMPVPLGELKNGHVAMVLMLRGIAHKAVANGNMQKNSTDWPTTDNVFGNHGVDCRKVMVMAGLQPTAKAHSP